MKFDAKQDLAREWARHASLSLDSSFVSVIIPHLDDLDGLDRCLALLGEQTFPRSRFEVLVVDNGSRCGPQELERVTAGRARLLQLPIRGAGPARNNGVLHARGDMLAFIDCDCQPNRAWLEKGVAALALCDIAGGRLVVLVEDAERMSPSEAFEKVFAFRNKHYVTRLGFTVAASMFVPRAVFEQVGGFENLVPEDIEWCRRAISRGYKIGYAEDSIIGHAARRTMADLKRKWRRMTLESYQVARKSRASRLLWLSRSWLVLLSVAPHFLYLMVTPRLSKPRDRFAAARALFEIRIYRFFLSHRIFIGRE